MVVTSWVVSSIRSCLITFSRIIVVAIVIIGMAVILALRCLICSSWVGRLLYLGSMDVVGF
jgi:hypothetical protein